MKKKKNLLAISLVGGALAISGCAYKEPSTSNVANLNDVDFSEDLEKQNRACENYILGFIGPFGKKSLPEAAGEANISNVEYVDYSHHHWVLFSQDCVNVYGN